MSTSEEAKNDDYSARLAKLKAKCADISHSSSSTGSANSSRNRTNDMSHECRSAIKNGFSDEIIEGMGFELSFFRIEVTYVWVGNKTLKSI